MTGENRTIAEVYPVDDIEGATVERLTYLDQDNDRVVFEIELDNGLVFEGNVTALDLPKSDIDLPDDLLIDGEPVDT